MARTGQPNPERDAKALAMHRLGLKLREIADHFDYAAPTSAWHAVRRARHREAVAKAEKSE